MQRLLHLATGSLCGGALFAIMALTFFDVGGRKLLSHSIPGSLELTELLMVVVIFAGLPLVSARREHVAFDSLDGHMPQALRRAQQSLVNLMCAAALAGLAYLMWKTGAQIAEYGETTAQLKISKAPFIHGIAASCLLTATIHAWLAFKPPAQVERSGHST